MNKKITEYGQKIIAEFLEKCKVDGTYQKVFVDHEDGLCLLDPSVRNAKDCSARFHLNYEEDTLNVIRGWQKEIQDNIAWYGEGFTITYDEVIAELEKCIEKTEQTKRVVQYSVDILIRNEEENNINLEELIAEALEEKGLYICGVGFVDDLTEAYKNYCEEA